MAHSSAHAHAHTPTPIRGPSYADVHAPNRRTPLLYNAQTPGSPDPPTPLPVVPLLHRYGEVGEKFDPNLHDALFQMVNEELEVGDIGAVLKTGYTLNDRVIRPAQVGAIKAP